MQAFKPMLAPNNDPLKDPDYFKNLRFPLLCSPKLDGIRAIVKHGAVKSRKFIDLPSYQVQELFADWSELDGEIIVGNETDHDVFNRTQSHVMSYDKPHKDISFRVFDCADERLALEPFEERLYHARRLIAEYKENLPPGSNVSLVEHELCEDLDQLFEFESKQLQKGYEGVMMRDPRGRYKHNRGTFKEGLIYKLKRFVDDEGVVIGFEEGTINENPDIRDNLGNAKRSTAKEGIVPANTLGKFIVDFRGNEIKVAAGAFTHAEREHIWLHQKLYKHKFLKFRHMTHGSKDLPRFPRAVGFRDEGDM